MTTILCYGDSNTWGAIPSEQLRYARNERWSGLLAEQLTADEIEVIEAGQPGRTCVWEDQFEPGKNGLTSLLPTLECHVPDLVVLMLGTNDLKSQFGLSAYEISRGAARLVQEIQRFEFWHCRSPQVLLVAPPPVYEVGLLAPMFVGAEAKSRQLATEYAARAKELGCHFFDAGQVAHSCPEEGVHWPIQAHQRFAEALAPVMRQILLG